MTLLLFFKHSIPLPLPLFNAYLPLPVFNAYISTSVQGADVYVSLFIHVNLLSRLNAAEWSV